MTKALGFGLTDLLISLLLSSLVMSALLQCYLVSKQQYQVTEQRLATHMDIEWVKDMMADSIRRAGFTPCLGLEALLVVDSRAPGRKISALTFKNEPLGLIQVNRMSEHFSQILKVQSPTQLLVAKESRFHDNDRVIIANCTHAEIHKILRLEPKPHSLLITLTKPLQFNYDKGASCGEWVEEQWRIKANAKGNEALYYDTKLSEELTPLIHSLKTTQQRLYGRRLLEIELGLEQDKTQNLVVAVRAL